MLCCAVLCCAVLCCAVLCCAVLCCAVLLSFIRQHNDSLSTRQDSTRQTLSKKPPVAHHQGSTPSDKRCAAPLAAPSISDKICSSLGCGKAEDETTRRLRSVMTLLRSTADESVAVQALNARGDDILELNVGGKLMSTTRETLTQVVC